MEGISDARDPDTAGLEALYRRHADWLRARISGAVGPAAADDIVQETYVRLARRADPIGEPVGRPLLLRIAKNLLRDDFRRRAVRLAAFAVARRSDPRAAQANQAEVVLFRQILASMPETYRDAFLLHRFEGRSYADIAKARQISVKTVEYRISQALAHCAAVLGEE